MPGMGLPVRLLWFDDGYMSVSVSPTQASTNRTGVGLPAVGPQWFGMAMGTGIFATLLQLAGPMIPGSVDLARVMLALAWMILLGLVAATATRFRAEPGALRATVTDAAVAPTWGMVAMGILAVGSASATVAHAWYVAAAMWGIGTVLGLCTAIGFGVVMLRGRAGTPTMVWGLALVPPMVSATTGASLAQHFSAHAGTFLAVSTACFVIALATAPITFARCYHHHLRVAPPVGAASASAWIPLGVVGQSAAAALKLSDVAGLGHTVAVGYAVAMLVLAAPLTAWAGYRTVLGFRDAMPFTPGWWAMTFPVGTVALGAHELGAQTHWAWATDVSLAALAVLACTWTLCAAMSIRSL